MSELFETVCGSRAAWRGLDDRGLVRVRGGDRVRFLNGMLTNDVAALQPGQSCPSLQLDRKGHILAQLEVLVLEDEILLDVAPGGERGLVDLLDKHIIADDVALERLGETWSQIALEGPEAAAAAEALGCPAVEPGTCAALGELVWVAPGELTATGRRALGPAAAIGALRRALDLPRIEAEAAEILRIEAFLPRVGVDTGERTFPQEARLESAVSFTKGCYIGQEIVARIHSRGAVNRLLVQLSTDAPVRPGAPIRVAERESGVTTSSAVSPLRGSLALGYVKKADAAPGSRVRIEDTGGVVIGPPLES